MLIAHTDPILEVIPQVLFLYHMVTSSPAANLVTRVYQMFSWRMKKRVKLKFLQLILKVN